MSCVILTKCFNMASSEWGTDLFRPARYSNLRYINVNNNVIKNWRKIIELFDIDDVAKLKL